MRYLPRASTKRVKRLLREFPALLIYGPRQCGKSTLVRALCPDWTHLDLERPSDQELLQVDLEGFLRGHPRRLAIDEAQRFPRLFPALRYAIDSGRGAGRYVLTGSASPSLVRSVSESLAGRIALIELTPFRVGELAAAPSRKARWLWGGYPPVHARRGRPGRLAWLDAYVSTYLERDLPSYGLRLPPERLRTLWTMLTHVHGNLLNVSDLARSLAVSPHTVDADLDVLEQTFMIRRLRPYHANVQKRLTKSPKLYLRDTGLLHFLAGLRDPKGLATWSRRGASFEGLVIEELIATAADQVVRPDSFFWRTHAGAEVDLLLVHGTRILPVEVKLGAAVGPRDVAGLRSCMADLGLRRGLVVYGGDEQRSLNRQIDLVPWTAIAEGGFDLPL
jgi:predicted AAA+ superfamily ATPase